MKGIFGINVLHAIARHKERKKKETVKCLFLSSEEDRKTNMEVVRLKK